MRCAAYCIATAFDNNGLLSYLKSQYTVTRYREVLHVQLKPDLSISQGAGNVNNGSAKNGDTSIGIGNHGGNGNSSGNDSGSGGASASSSGSHISNGTQNGSGSNNSNNDGFNSSNLPRGDSDVFFFPYGSVVCWGLDEHLERDLLQTVRRFAIQHVEPIEDDVFSYEFGEEGSQAKIVEDEITLPHRDVLTKLAFSHGMAQSVKLAAFEQTIQRTIHLTRELPELLAQQGGIQLSRKDIRRMMGRLFIDRSSINLHQELLDTPEYFWEHSDLEPYYALMAHYLDRERRVNVLNQRLLILQELFDMLAAELNHQHSSRLEWTIIWLIVIEVVLTVGKDILRIW